MNIKKIEKKVCVQKKTIYNRDSLNGNSYEPFHHQNHKWFDEMHTWHEWDIEVLLYYSVYIYFVCSYAINKVGI